MANSDHTRDGEDKSLRPNWGGGGGEWEPGGTTAASPATPAASDVLAIYDRFRRSMDGHSTNVLPHEQALDAVALVLNAAYGVQPPEHCRQLAARLVKRRDAARRRMVARAKRVLAEELDLGIAAGFATFCVCPILEISRPVMLG